MNNIKFSVALVLIIVAALLVPAPKKADSALIASWCGDESHDSCPGCGTGGNCIRQRVDYKTQQRFSCCKPMQGYPYNYVAIYPTWERKYTCLESCYGVPDKETSCSRYDTIITENPTNTQYCSGG